MASQTSTSPSPQRPQVPREAQAATRPAPTPPVPQAYRFEDFASI